MCCRGHYAHTSCTVGPALALCGKTSTYYYITFCSRSKRGRDWMQSSLTSRGLVNHLGFPKIRVARETWSRRVSSEGWMTHLVSSSVSWLLLAFSNCRHSPTVECSSSKLFLHSTSIYPFNATEVIIELTGNILGKKKYCMYAPSTGNVWWKTNVRIFWSLSIIVHSHEC